MKSTKLSTMAIHPAQLARAALAVIFTLVLAACGGGGTTPITDVTVTVGGLRPLSPAFAQRKAVNYSPYRTATTVGDASKATDIANEDITDAMVIEDLTLLQQAGFGMIRLFNSDEKVAERTLRVINDPANSLDFKVYLGMWMAGYNEPGNQAQIALGVALAKSYPDIVVAVSVGNESLVNWSDHAMKPAVLASHIAYVRSQITQPVTTDDNWAYYAAADRSILDVIDFASVHTYAMVDTHYNPTFWDWKQTAVAEGPDRAVAMMKAAMDSTKKDYTAARSFVDSKGYSALPMIVGETGWMAKDASGGAHWYKFLAHPVNQKMYFDSLQAWWSAATGPKAVFYFEAFDEQWKGSDDNWGLFNRLREARYAIQSAHAQSDTFKYEPGSYTAADALYFKLPTVHSAVTDNNYVIYSETVTGFVPTGLRWDPFANTFWQSVADAAPGDGTQSYEIDPRPETWGWGMLYQSAAVSPAPAVTENLSQFAAGSLNVYIKTSYGSALNEKIEIGISSDTDLDGAQEAFLQISNGQYGFCNTGNWCKVTIPLRDFVAANPKLDLRLVLSRFMIADRFAFTGNTTHTGLPKIKIDAVYWSK